MKPYATFHDLSGASVFITGGGSGIGAALTEGFLRQGAKTTFIGRSDASGFVERMERETGSRPLFLQCDATDVEALRKAIDSAAQSHGGLDVLVNNAANDQRCGTPEVDEAFWEESIAVNLKAYFFACQKAISLMKESRTKGSIVNFSSISYLMGNAGYPVYVAANSGITGMTRSLAREFGPDGIRVNAFLPGWVLTEKQMEKWATPEALSAHLDRQCLKEHLQPRDMVEGVLFLASKASRMMTGQAVSIDGGVVATG